MELHAAGFSSFVRRLCPASHSCESGGRLWRRILNRKDRPGRIPFTENVSGDFYVEDGCCTSCGMPSTVAPELFSYAESGHCYVRKQPSDATELRKMIDAFEVQDIGCIRYKGTNRVIQIQLIVSGEGDQCDALDHDLKVLNDDVKADRRGHARHKNGN